jgi:hypothetical protein
VEIDYLVTALEKTLSFLQESESSCYGRLSVEEVIRQLEEELGKARSLQPVGLKRLEYLFAPTGSLQDISIDNGWGNEFLEISKAID